MFGLKRENLDLYSINFEEDETRRSDCVLEWVPK